MFWKTVVFALFVVGVFADGPELPQLKEEHLQYLRPLCKNAEDKTDEVVAAGRAFVDCVKGLVNVEELKKEIEDAKPRGALDEVFSKYCAKTPQLKTCAYTLIDATEPCLEEKAKELLPTAKNGTDKLLDFVCYKDGDRIALFIAEKGPECFTQKMNSIRDCVNADRPDSLESAKALTVVDRCTKFDKISTCIVTALEGCDTPTPANMAESMFKFVRKNTPCKEALPKD